MSIICPTVLANSADEFERQLMVVKDFASRIQIDLMDGVFASSKSINPAQVWWPEGVQADIHLMFSRPVEQLETLVSLSPNLVILHAEAEGDIASLMKHFQNLGIKAGVALLKDTKPEEFTDLIKTADHVLLFSGKLGEFGGTIEPGVLEKIDLVRTINPNLEIGWDGGANSTNIAELSVRGVDVINVGSAIQQADNPAVAYGKLKALVQTE